MIDRRRGDYLLPLVFFEKDVVSHFRAIILNISPDGAMAVSNDRKLLAMDPKSIVGKEFTLEFSFFDLDTKNIRASVKKIRPGLFKGHEITIDFTFTAIDTITRRDINRIIQAQRLS